MGVSERRRRDRERRRESIVEAAEHVFRREGFEASTMEQVAAEAEVSKGTLYLYFENKDALRAALGERWVRTLVERLSPRLDEAPSGLEGVRAVLESYHEHFASHADHGRLALGWISSPPSAAAESCGSFEAHREAVRELVGMVIATIERGRRDRSIRADVDPHLLAPQMWGGFLGVWMLVLNQDRVRFKGVHPSVDMNRLVPCFIDTMLRGIAAYEASEAPE